MKEKTINLEKRLVYRDKFAVNKEAIRLGLAESSL